MVVSCLSPCAHSPVSYQTPNRCRSRLHLPGEGEGLIQSEGPRETEEEERRGLGEKGQRRGREQLAWVGGKLGPILVFHAFFLNINYFQA